MSLGGRRRLLLFLLGIIAFGYPMAVVIDDLSVPALPLAPLWLFGVWAVLIVFAYRLRKRG